MYLITWICFLCLFSKYTFTVIQQFVSVFQLNCGAMLSYTKLYWTLFYAFVLIHCYRACTKSNQRRKWNIINAIYLTLCIFLYSRSNPTYGQQNTKKLSTYCIHKYIRPKIVIKAFKKVYFFLLLFSLISQYLVNLSNL